MKIAKFTKNIWDKSCIVIEQIMILIFQKINFSWSYKDHRQFFKWNYDFFLHNIVPLIILHIKILQ